MESDVKLNTDSKRQYIPEGHYVVDLNGDGFCPAESTVSTNDRNDYSHLPKRTWCCSFL